MTFLSVLAILQSNAGPNPQCPLVRMAEASPRPQGMETRSIPAPPTHGNGFEVHKVIESTFIVDPGGICEENGGFVDDHHPVGEGERNHA